MEEVAIVTRDVNGKRIKLEYLWENVCAFIRGHGGLARNIHDDDEILLITIDGICVYSALTSPAITWEDVTGFFA
jgi:hypothetical protein